MDYYENFDKKSYVDEYIKRSMLIGRRIYIVNGDDKIPVTAKEIDRDCRLKVEYEDGSEKWLSSGEVSIENQINQLPLRLNTKYRYGFNYLKPYR